MDHYPHTADSSRHPPLQWATQGPAEPSPPPTPTPAPATRRHVESPWPWHHARPTLWWTLSWVCGLVVWVGICAHAAVTSEDRSSQEFLAKLAILPPEASEANMKALLGHNYRKLRFYYEGGRLAKEYYHYRYGLTGNIYIAIVDGTVFSWRFTKPSTPRQVTASQRRSPDFVESVGRPSAQEQEIFFPGLQPR